MRRATTVCAVGVALAAMLPAPHAAEPVEPSAAEKPAQPARADKAALDVQGPWTIVQARVEPIVDRRRARLDLGPDGQLAGHTSCSPMSGSYTLDGKRIQIGRISTSKVACSPLGLEQEDRILTALELAYTISVRNDGLLEIRDADGRGLLRAVRPDADR